MSVQSSSGSLEGPPSWSQLSTSPSPGSAAAARSLLNHTPPSGRPREGKRRRPSRGGFPHPAPPHAAAPRPRGGGEGDAGGREAVGLPGGPAAGGVGGGSRGSWGWERGWGGGGGGWWETDPGCARVGTGRGARSRRGRPRAGAARVGSLGPAARPFLLHLLVHSVLLTSWPWVSGGFSCAAAFILEPPPLPSRTPPPEAGPACAVCLYLPDPEGCPPCARGSVPLAGGDRGRASEVIKAHSDARLGCS